jgi:hypothetical protein
MRFDELRLKTKETGIFSLGDIFKWFPRSTHETVKNQLKDWTAKGYLMRMKKTFLFIRSK